MNKKFIFLLGHAVTVTLLLFSCAAGAETDDAVAYNKQGSELISSGLYEEAIESLKQAVRIKPDYAEAYNNLGLAYSMLQRHLEAINSFKQAIRMKRNYAEAYKNLGVVHLNMGHYEESIDAFNKAISMKPDYETAYLNLGEAYHKIKKTREAIGALQKALLIKPDFAEAHNSLGVIYQDMGDYEEATRLYEEAIRINPYFAETYTNLGALYGKTGRDQEAIEFLKKAIGLDPDYAYTYYNLGLVYQKLGSVEDAFSNFKQAISLEPRMIEAHYNLGLLYLQQGSYQNAIHSFVDAIHIKADAELYYRLGLAYYNAGRIQEAIGAYREAIRLNRNHAEAHNSLGLAYYVVRRNDDAIKACGEAIRLKPDYADAHKNLEMFERKEPLPLAQDIEKDYTKISPYGQESLTYSVKTFPASVPTPPGWFMLARKEDSPHPVKAVFYKYDPDKKLPEGVSRNPFIEVCLLPNPNKVIAKQFALEAAEALEKKKIRILVPYYEGFTVDNHPGAHYSIQAEGIDGELEIIDNYIFAKEDSILCVRSHSSASDYRNNSKEMGATIEGVKFPETTAFKGKKPEADEWRLVDGTYFSGDSVLSVKVTVKNGEIADIEILEHRGGGQKYADMIRPLIDKIIEKQSTKIDAITGATVSSQALIDAVNDALNKAQK